MAERTYIESGKLLKQGPIAPCYYFHGPVDLLKDEAIADLLARLLEPSLRDFNLDVRSAQQLNPEDIEPLCRTLPMMAERRVVIIRDVEAWARKTRTRAAVVAYLDRPSPETVLILVQGSSEAKPDAELAARSTSIAFEPLRREHVEKWLDRRAAARTLVLAPEAAAHLVSVLGDDLGLLAAELEKLSGLAGESALTLAQVESLLGVRHGETADDWCREVLTGQPGPAVAMLPHLLEQPGVSGVKLLALLGTHLIGVALLRAQYEKGVRGRALQSTAWEVLKRARPGNVNWGESAALWTRAAPLWSDVHLRRALRAARDADQALKNTTISTEVGILTDLVLGLALPAREAA
jgi:DNA polymerase-3 subunit delta